MTEPPDPTLDALLDLDGQVLVVDPEGGHWVRFAGAGVAGKPPGWTICSRCTGRMANGWSASTTPIPVAQRKRGGPQDHHQRLRTIRTYDYRDAATLLADLWETVDAVLRERGVIP